MLTQRCFFEGTKVVNTTKDFESSKGNAELSKVAKHFRQNQRFITDDNDEKSIKSEFS
jgi:hypothetical protein